MMLPLFKTHYSIGKSILTLASPSKVKEGGADSIIDIALDAGLKQLILVEDSMHGFLEAKRRCEENDIQLIFGIRVNMCQDYEVEKDRVPFHKIIIFAKNDDGVKNLKTNAEVRHLACHICRHRRRLGVLLRRRADLGRRSPDLSGLGDGLFDHRRSHLHHFQSWRSHARTGLHIHVPLAAHPSGNDG